METLKSATMSGSPGMEVAKTASEVVDVVRALPIDRRSIVPRSQMYLPLGVLPSSHSAWHSPWSGSLCGTRDGRIQIGLTTCLGIEKLFGPFQLGVRKLGIRFGGGELRALRRCVQPNDQRTLLDLFARFKVE